MGALIGLIVLLVVAAIQFVFGAIRLVWSIACWFTRFVYSTITLLLLAKIATAKR